MNLMILAKEYDSEVKKACEKFSCSYNNINPEPDIIFNYNLTGKKKRTWMRKNKPLITNALLLSGLNPNMDSYNILKLAETLGIPTIETHKNIPFGLSLKDYSKYYIINKFGKKIKLTNYRFPQKDEFIQKRINTSTFIKLDFMYSIFNSVVGFALDNPMFQCMEQINKTSFTPDTTKHICKKFIQKLCLHIKPDICTFSFLYNEKKQILFFTGIHATSLTKAINIFKDIDSKKLFKFKKYLVNNKRGEN